MGVKCIEVEGVKDEKSAVPKFDAVGVRGAVIELLRDPMD